MLTVSFFRNGLWTIGAAIAALVVWAILICEAAV
jgi:hypothetical protein